LSLSETIQKVDQYIRVIKLVELKENLRIFRAQIQSNFDSREREVAEDEGRYMTRRGFIHITIEDNGSGISYSL
jgi:hypothetical protein